MGQIANQMALELFFKIKERIKEKKKQKQDNKNNGSKKQTTFSCTVKNLIWTQSIWENTLSRKVLERNGFLLEGKMERAVIKNNNIFDLCIYGKVR